MQNIDASEMIHRFADQCLDVILFSDIALHENGPTTCVFDCLLSRLAGNRVNISDDNTCAFAGKCDCAGTTDTLACAGDDDYIVRKSPCHSRLPSRSLQLDFSLVINVSDAKPRLIEYSFQLNFFGFARLKCQV